MIGQIISHYKVLRQIGEGGMGVVYVAEDMRLGRRVAMKFPTMNSGENNRARFLREARAVSLLSHAHVAAVYDYGETSEGQPFIVMELVEGRTLSDLLHQGELTIGRAVEIIEDVASALAEAHRRGVIHRDVKPSNVIINERGEVKVLDFGLAKHVQIEDDPNNGHDAPNHLSLKTRSDVIIGTPLYLSPEQARGAPVDRRSDLFALGALLYECVAGRPAFSGANVIEIGAQVLHVNPPPPSQLNPRVSPELDRVTLKALAKRPEDRYQNAEELIQDLRKVYAALPKSDTTRVPRLTKQQSGSTSTLMMLSDNLRRPRLSLAALLVILLAGVIAFSVAVRWTTPSIHTPSGPAKQRYEEGTAALRDGAYYKASKALEEAVSIDKNYALAHARLAEAQMELDLQNDAMRTLLRVSTLVPNSRSLPDKDRLYLDAIKFTAASELAPAIKAYAELASLNPDDATVHVDLGRAYERNDEVDKAIESYTKATDLNPEYATAFLRLGVLYGRQLNWAGASLAFEKAERLYRTEPPNLEGVTEVFYQRGYLFSGMRHLAEARKELEQALEMAQQNNHPQQRILSLIQLSTVALQASDPVRAEEYARQAVNLAQSNSMYNLTCRGLIVFGTVALDQRKFDDADASFKQALDLASRYGLPRNMAWAQFSLGSLRLTWRRPPEEAMPFATQALDFYRQKGYRKEMAQTLLLISRIQRYKGDYEAAQKTLNEQFSVAMQVSDQALLAESHSEISYVLFRLGNFTEALSNITQCVMLTERLNNKRLLGHSLLTRAELLWRLGRYDEARDASNRARAVAEAGSNNKNLLSGILLNEAMMELSLRRPHEAKEKLDEAVALAGGEARLSLILLKQSRGETETLLGKEDEGQKLCEEAVKIATAARDPWQISTTSLSLAEALYAAGNYAGALEAARTAITNASNLGQVELGWRACLCAARASQRLGDTNGALEHLANATRMLSQLQQTWGDQNYNSYLSRPDIKFLRSELDTLPVAVR